MVVGAAARALAVQQPQAGASSAPQEPAPRRKKPSTGTQYVTAALQKLISERWEHHRWHFVRRDVLPNKDAAAAAAGGAGADAGNDGLDAGGDGGDGGDGSAQLYKQHWVKEQDGSISVDGMALLADIRHHPNLSGARAQAARAVVRQT